MAPAHAGSTPTISDPAGDTADPVLYQSDLQKPKPTTPSPSSDILSTSLISTTIGGSPALQATIVVKGTVPAIGSTNLADYQGPKYQGQSPFNGGSWYVLYQDPQKQTGIDNLGSGCTRLDGGRVRDQQGNYRDGYRNFIGLTTDFNGSWSHTPEIGFYDPNATDVGFNFIDLNSTPSMAGKWSESVVNNGTSTTITITVATKVTTTDAECVGGLFAQDFGAPGDNINNVSALTTNNQTVLLPATVPGTPATDPIDSVGGLISFSDWTNTNTSPSVETWDPGIAGPDNIGAGAGCPTPTFGGTLPSNPLWSLPALPPPLPTFRQGQPCDINNPVGATFIDSNYNFLY
jgi:hypothetical protein